MKFLALFLFSYAYFLLYIALLLVMFLLFFFFFIAFFKKRKLIKAFKSTIYQKSVLLKGDKKLYDYKLLIDQKTIFIKFWILEKRSASKMSNAPILKNALNKDLSTFYNFQKAPRVIIVNKSVNISKKRNNFYIFTPEEFKRNLEEILNNYEKN